MIYTTLLEMMMHTDETLFVPKETVNVMMTRAFLELAAKLDLMEKQLASAQSRIHELEGQVYGGSVK